ncbi:LacI family DNA-binding transcriptional regulator [Pseudoxanthomonas sacheonensis]|uniref:LacI family DNA-binding transcriptional regulator n=1 Tax=Pseudoxanthomonas sacheonensis TaxID=443615 RepID=UPI0013D18A82|nr:LacI family DNA-binding transcriptional regulator [Pseudoxanthomonas sacheonensis]KAF1711785.1 LacI family transcriptional regulator [Pseudoxanthomonas sacheonensis]
MARTNVTIKDVAREASVSVATVSRALNGHENVAEGVRKHVTEIANRLRYQPHAAARSLSSRRTQTIGVVLPDLYGEFFSELIRGIDAVARARRQHLLVSSYHGHPEEQGEALRAMRGRVDGLLVLSPYADRPGFLTDNLPTALPAVLINTHLPDATYPVLSIDNFGGASAMVKHLAEAGHKRIAFICGPEDNFDASERLRGYRTALAQHLPDAEPVELPGDFDESSGYEAGKRILAAKQRPDAVFAANDMMALGCLYAFNEAGVKVPADIALAGFDDIPLARFVHPTLTTMRVSIAELGGLALTRLLQSIESEESQPSTLQTLVPELIVRESSTHATRRSTQSGSS